MTRVKEMSRKEMGLINSNLISRGLTLYEIWSLLSKAKLWNLINHVQNLKIQMINAWVELTRCCNESLGSQKGFWWKSQINTKSTIEMSLKHYYQGSCKPRGFLRICLATWIKQAINVSNGLWSNTSVL